MTAPDALGTCPEVWTSPRSGQPIYCQREEGHVGACRGGGWWRDEDERNLATVNERVREALRIGEEGI